MISSPPLPFIVPPPPPPPPPSSPLSPHLPPPLMAQLFPSFMPSHGFSPRSRHSESDFAYQLPRKLIPFPTGIEHKGFLASRNGRFQRIGIVCKRMEDGFYIRRCVELARKAIGCTSPNPMVGCVIVKNGEIVGEGFHPKAGQPHAEVFALREAGSLAENATAYVSLEPCNHYGRTPPCTEALINAKVKQVIVGMVDPNPIVASKGVEKLKSAGIDVIVGVEEMLCQKLNEAYIHRIHTGKPFVTVRYSLSLNGGMLSHLGRGAEESGGYYSKLLQKYDGIVLSADYIGSISTLPTSLEPGANQPFQIIIAGHINSLRLPSTIINSTSHFIVMAEKKIDVEPKSENIETVLLEKMTLTSLLEFCGCRGLCSILLDVREGNGALTKLLEGSLQEGLLQKVVMELCPVLNGSKAPLPSFGLQPRQLKDLQSNAVNESVLVEGYL